MSESIRYRKKPVVIEAVRYEGHGSIERRLEGRVPEWMWQAFENRILQPTNGDDPLYVITDEGKMELRPGDYLIRGVQGELYPCKPEVFEQTYEPVGEDG